MQPPSHAMKGAVESTGLPGSQWSVFPSPLEASATVVASFTVFQTVGKNRCWSAVPGTKVWQFV